MNLFFIPLLSNHHFNYIHSHYTPMSQLRYSTLFTTVHRHLNHHHTPFSTSLPSLSPSPTRHLRFSTSSTSHGGNNNGGNNNGKRFVGDTNNNGDSSRWEKLGLLGMFVKGWKDRVKVDPQFPFKVVMEELVGVTSCVIGDMASRPNYGLNELDLVFSTLVVTSILNFTLMYILAPVTTTSMSPAASSLFKKFVTKGAIFGLVGFGAGLVGTVISNGLTRMKNKLDSDDEVNKSPDTLLNAVTWGLHMAISSNLRYQVLNAVEGGLVKVVVPGVFKTAVVGLRCGNNVLGGVSFVMLARLTGSQSVEKAVEATEEEEKEKVVASS